MSSDSIEYAMFDADNHYYESADCFTRHVEKAHAEDAIKIARSDDGTFAVHFRNELLGFCAGELTERSEPPGALMAILSTKGVSSRKATRMSRPHVPAFVNRSARLALMDEQGIEATLMLPTVAVGIEQDLVEHPQAIMTNFRAFNRWLEEEWGFGADGRIFGVPMLSLHDLDGAVAELDRLLAAGAKTVYLRPGHINGRSPADAYFDPFWARINESGVPVALHLSAGLMDQSADWGEDPKPHHSAMSALQFGFFFCDRPIMDTLGALVLHNLFGRYPNVKVLSIENGSGWLPYFEKILYKGWRMAPFGPAPWGRPTENPVDIFHRHVWLAPFPEERNKALVDRLGADRVLFGSDYPHPEGTEHPIDFTRSLEGVSDTDLRKVMRDNLRSLLTA